MSNPLLMIPLLMLLMALLNRFRGGGIILSKIPVPLHRRYITTMVLFPILWSLTTWQFAAFVSLQYLLLVLLPWGRWYTIGYAPRWCSGEPDAFENALEKATAFLGRSGSDYVSFVIRNLICLSPCFGASYILESANPAIIAVTLAVVIPEIYRLCWNFIDEMDVPTTMAEWISGLAIGLAIAAGLLA